MDVLDATLSAWHVLYMILLPAVLLWILYYRHKRARLIELAAKIPGPKAFPFIGNGLDFLGGSKDVYKKLMTFSQEHKPLLRVWLGPTLHLLPFSPEDIEVILSSSKFIDKSHEYRLFEPWLGDGLLTSTGQKWHSHRKILTPTFHFKILEEFVEVFNRNTDTLLRCLKNEIGSSGFDIMPYVCLCALDIICESAMGTVVDAQKKTDSEYVKSVKRISDIIHQRHFKPWLQLDLVMSLTGLGRDQAAALKVLHGFTNKVIKERKEEYQRQKSDELKETVKDDDLEGKKKRLAFLDLLLEASEDGAVLSDQDIRDEVNTFMFEGHDTTSAGISFTLYCLGANPDIQEKVVEELNAIFGGSIRPATLRDLQEMKYLERCIKESLRLYPSVPLFSRIVKQDTRVNKHIFPAGASVSIFVSMIHRNPEIFPDPEKFDPDRFLPETAQGRHPYAYIPFSAGPRNCIGQKFAMLEEKAVISSLLRTYKLEAVSKREDLELQAELILKSATGLQVKVVPRNKG